MAAVGNLILKDQVDANVTYYPVLVRTGDEVVYVDRTESLLALQSKARFTIKETATVRQVTGKVTLPYTVDMFNTTTFNQAMGGFNFVLPNNMSAIQRTKIRKLLIAALSDAVTTALCDNGESPW